MKYYRNFPDDVYLEGCTRSRLRQYWVPDTMTEVVDADIGTIMDAVDLCVDEYVDMEEKSRLEECDDSNTIGSVRKEPAPWQAFLPVGPTWGGYKGMRNENRHTTQYYQKHL